MLSMAVVILALMGPAIIIVQYRAAEHFQTSARARGLSMARSIAAVATPALLSYNYIGLQEAAHGAARDEGIAYVIIHDKEGLIAGDSRTIDTEARQIGDEVSARASESREPLVQRVLARIADGQPVEVLDVAAPVYIADSADKWGTVRVGVSLEPVKKAVARITWSLTALGMMGFFLCLLGARAASRRITRPVQRLREGTLALAQGDLKHRIEIHTGDEIEDLARHFNEMADEIEARQAEARDARAALEKLNTSLEEEVKHRTAAQVRSESKYRTLVEGSPVGIAIIQNGRTVYVNPAYRKLVGDETRTVLDVLHPEDREAFFRDIQNWTRVEPFGPMEVRIKSHNRETRFAELRWMALDLDGEAAELCMLVDVSAVRKLQDQVAVSDKLRAMGELASGVAHDFNNCLAIILGRCQLLARKTQDEYVLKGLRVIEKAASDGGQTVRRIQDFARMREGSPSSVYDLAELVNDVVEITRGKWKDEAEGKGLKIEVETSFHHSSVVTGSPAELREALTNLILNSLDAMPRGGRIRFATTDEVKGDIPYVRLDVTDTGVGIPDAVKAQVFDPFFSTKGNLGTGLGLSITYGIVTRHGGTISVESQVGEGTTFTLKLPAGTAEPIAKDDTSDQELPFIPASILVVDDEPEILEVLLEGLSSAGYKVTACSGGQDALVRLELVNYDLVLTDLGMPGVSGWDVVNAARSRRPDILVGLVTGWGETLDPEKVERNGVSLVVAKPFEVNHFLKQVRALLFRRHREAA
jgi:PAS domain S-box-containing protein